MANTKQVRAWARSQGMKVGQRGRLHPTVIAAYTKANGLGHSTPSDPPTSGTPKPQKVDATPAVILRWGHKNGFPGAQKVGKKLRAAFEARSKAPVVKADAPDNVGTKKEVVGADGMIWSSNKCGYCYSGHNVRPADSHGLCKGTTRTAKRGWKCDCTHPAHKEGIKAA